MSNENENDQCQSRFAWRPATRGDIGSIARFRNAGSRIWVYGMLDSILQEATPMYKCLNERGCAWWDVCEIQYDPNEEP